MAELRVAINFRIPGLWVAREILGRSIEVDRDGFRLVLTIPQLERDFLHWQTHEYEPYWTIGPPSISTSADAAPYLLSVFIVQVHTDVHVPLPEADLIDEGIDDPDIYYVVAEAIDPVREAARRLVSDLIAWAKVTARQTWHGRSSEEPEEVGPALVTGLESGTRIRTQPAFRSGFAFMRSEGSAVTPDILAEIETRIRTSTKIPVAETLLADAEYEAWYHPEGDKTTAVLLAAIACEMKVRQDLQHRASQSQDALVDYVLSNPREVTVTAVRGLFDKVMQATQGRSLRTANRGLYDSIERLFQERNRVAHGHGLSDDADVGALVRSAREAFEWLDAR